MVRRILLNVCGLLSLVLGIIGLFLPLLPTTPFVLLASACFIKASPRLHAWLHAHRLFGPILVNWQQHRAVSPQVKKRGTVFIVASFMVSIWYVPHLGLKVGLFCMLVVLLCWFIRLPTHSLVADREENH